MMAADVSLLHALADTLPTGLELRVYHVSTRPTSVPPLFSGFKERDEEKTYCESHLLSIALPQDDRPYELLIFAIEVLIFTTQSLTTIFVSKADSTGILDILKLDRSAGSVVKSLTTAFLRFLVRSRREGPRVVLSLFARSQNQYLFPGSVEYSGKHVLDDRQLIKWWCRTLDPIITYSSIGDIEPKLLDTKAYLLVPGCDKTETKAFFPPDARLGTPTTSRWQASYPMKLLVTDVSAPLRCLIPRLPDDPKSRFLTDLDDSKDKKGHWRSVRTMDQFWEMMSFRQECSAGRLVGFIWVVFGDQDAKSTTMASTGHANEEHGARNGTEVVAPPSPGTSQVAGSRVAPMPEVSVDDLQEIALPSSPPPSSPVLPPHEPGTRDAGDADAEAAAQYYDESQTLPVSWPKETRGEVIVDSEQYDTLTDHLLKLDFSTRADGEKSTSSFIAKAAELAGNFWGKSITGRNVRFESTRAAAMPRGNGVNILTGIRKKRKADVVEGKAAVLDQRVNVLSAGLIRKKAKP
jgi:regulator of Ty1 transposition protein 109